MNQGYETVNKVMNEGYESVNFAFTVIVTCLFFIICRVLFLFS